MKHSQYEIYYKNFGERSYSGLRAVSALFKRKKVIRVLDFCCGNGRNSIYDKKRIRGVWI